MTEIRDQPHDATDGHLLTEFVQHRRQDAFAQLVARHGAMVLVVCRAILRNASDAEDAAQAVFLTLAQRASSLQGRPTLVGWLHRVAWYIATRAATAAAIRRRHEREAALMPQETTNDPQDIAADVLHAELGALPEKYRVPLLLHHIEGRTEEETAALLKCAPGTASMRLSRGRLMLRQRLQRRGVAVSATGMMAVVANQASAEVLPTFITTASQTALAVLAGKTAAAAAPASVATLAKGALDMLFWNKMKLVVTALAVIVLAGGVGVVTYGVGAEATTSSPSTLPAAKPDAVAQVVGGATAIPAGHVRLSIANPTIANNLCLVQQLTMEIPKGTPSALIMENYGWKGVTTNRGGSGYGNTNSKPQTITITLVATLAANEKPDTERLTIYFEYAGKANLESHIVAASAKLADLVKIDAKAGDYALEQDIRIGELGGTPILLKVSPAANKAAMEGHP
jgi:RNA polymerase sigma factor (sigma-70 family)